MNLIKATINKEVYADALTNYTEKDLNFLLDYFEFTGFKNSFNQSLSLQKMLQLVIYNKLALKEIYLVKEEVPFVQEAIEAFNHINQDAPSV